MKNLIYIFVFIIFAVCYAKAENMIEFFWWSHHQSSTINVDGGIFLPDPQQEQVVKEELKQEPTQKAQEPTAEPQQVISQTELPQEKIEEVKVTKETEPEKEIKETTLEPITITAEAQPQEVKEQQQPVVLAEPQQKETPKEITKKPLTKSTNFKTLITTHKREEPQIKKELKPAVNIIKPQQEVKLIPAPLKQEKQPNHLPKRFFILLFFGLTCIVYGSTVLIRTKKV